MELKNKLQDYTREEFMSFVMATIMNKGPEQQAWISHFNAIVELPNAAELLLNPPLGMAPDTLPTPEYVVAYVKSQYNQKGNPAFKDDTLPVPKDNNSLSKEESAIKLSTLKKASAELLLARIALSGQAFDEGLSRFGSLLDSATAQPAPEASVADYVENIAVLEAAQERLNQASTGFKYHQTALNMSWDGAQRDSNSPFYNAPMQTALLAQLTQERDAYLARLSTIQQQREALHERATLFFAEASLQLARLRAAVDNPPPRVFQASLSSAKQHPALLLPEGGARWVNQVSDDLRDALRSAPQWPNTGHSHP